MCFEFVGLMLFLEKLAYKGINYARVDSRRLKFFCSVKPGFHIVVSVVSVVRKKFIGQM